MFSRKKASESKKKLSLHPVDFTFFDFKKIKSRIVRTKQRFGKLFSRFANIYFNYNEMSLFETRKPRQFQYKPRFYDPNKEELERLKAKYGDNEGEAYKRRIDFRSAMKAQKDKKIGKPASALRIMLIAVLIVGLLYFLLYIVEQWQ